MDERRLSFNEQRFLELYRRFFKEPYPAAANNNQNAHVKGQKAVYMLMLKQVCVGDYGFVWQQYGPCSNALQEMMRELDNKPLMVEEFYHDFPQDDARTTKKLYSDDPNSERLFYLKDAEKIDAVREELQLPKESPELDPTGDTPVRRWMELLGSLAYISSTRLPGASEERIWQELQKAKSKEKYRNAPQEEKESAFRVLRAAKLLSQIN